MGTTSMYGPSPLLEVRGVTVTRDKTLILQDFSWHVNPGENWIVFGPNGAGKTTLLNVLQGYLWPSEGSVHVLGGQLGRGVDVREMRTEISVVSEAVKGMINEDLTGLEVVVTGARAHLNLFSPPRPEELELAHAMADLTGIVPLLEKAFAIMSTGERQRVLITRSLMLMPRVVILDEPCAGLDLAGREWVLQTIERIADAPEPPTLLLTTHHVEEVTPSFTHALLLKDGRMHMAGAIEEVFTAAALSDLFNLPLDLRRANGRWMASAVP